MTNNKGKESGSSAGTPHYWSSSVDSRGETTLTYAVRAGKNLRRLDTWDFFLLKKSRLPGPRGNIELPQIVADEGNLKLFRRLQPISPNHPIVANQ